MSTVSAWAFYLAGALLTLAWKLVRYCYHGVRMQKKISDLLFEWFFESSSENAISWITTIAVVWVIGVAYIARVDSPWLPLLKLVPMHISFAFLLGSLMELAAPAAAKWLLSKLPGGGAAQ